MDRDPDIKVKRELRKEVAFGCPVEGCGCPYLTWHHFDPPWNERQHHEPKGMIALCREHHDKADGGAFTKQQLIALKQRPFTTKVVGRFDWMRNTLLLATGGGFYFDPFIILKLNGRKIISFCRDGNNYLLLNINMYNEKGDLKFQMKENIWTFYETPSDLTAPPSGKLLRIQYPNKDKVEVKFLSYKIVRNLRNFINKNLYFLVIFFLLR